MNDLIKFQFPSSVSELSEYAANIAQELMDAGEVDPVAVMVQLKKAETFIDCLKANFKTYATAEAGKRQTTSSGGAKIELRSTGKWDFAYCNDPEWNSLEAQKIKLDALQKARERFLKGVTKQIEITDTESGEVYTINPPVKTANEILYITLDK